MINGTCQFFTASYVKDLDFLEASLRSIEKYARGFLCPVVNIPAEDDAAMRDRILCACADTIITHRDEREARGPRAKFMAAQIAMLRADQYTTGDYIFLLGSESIATGPVTTDIYFRWDLPELMFSFYSDLELCHRDCFVWREGTKRALGFEPVADFMRRLPCVYPRALYADLRAHVEARFSQTVPTDFDQVIYTLDHVYQSISEQNLLGQFAYSDSRWFMDKFYWVNAGCRTLHHAPWSEYPNPFATFWSHGGLDRPCDLEFELDGKSIFGRTPRDVIQQVLT